MKSASEERLREIYDGDDDPWNFRTSDYEQAKFRDTVAALRRCRYDAALEVGCGNGELAAHIAARCDAYVGVDSVETALAAARRRVPGATFLRLHLPAELPEGAFDLVVLSEILYFLSPRDIGGLARQIATRWPTAEILTVNFLEETENAMQGEDALNEFAATLGGLFGRTAVTVRPRYRIDRFLGEGRSGDAK